MGFSLRFLRIPRPQSFLYVMSLQTGASLITLSLLLNKVSGLYGLLAILTGFHLSPFQLSMYIYSLLALALTASLAPYIRRQAPLQCLALAWFYLLDSIINAAYTAVFAVTWFLVMSQHHHSAPMSGFGSSTIDDTAGFTNPKYNVSSVQVTAGGQDAVAAAQPASAPAGTADGTLSGSPSLGNGVLQPESFESIGIICTLWTIRIYFVLVMLAFARQCLRQHSFHTRTSTSRHGGHLSTQSRNPSTVTTVDLDLNPFCIRTPEGQGWKGRVGRLMVSVGQSYWFGVDDDSNWMSGMSRKFRKSGDVHISSGNPFSFDGGPTERERRRRSGTGPPLPSQAVVQALSLQQQGQSHGQSQGTGIAMGHSVKIYDMPEARK